MTHDRAPDRVRGTYRALLLQGLQPGEAANLTGYLHGLPSAGIRWTVAEVEAIVRHRAAHLRTPGATPARDALAIAAPLQWDLS